MNHFHVTYRTETLHAHIVLMTNEIFKSPSVVTELENDCFTIFLCDKYNVLLYLIENDSVSTN